MPAAKHERDQEAKRVALQIVQMLPSRESDAQAVMAHALKLYREFLGMKLPPLAGLSREPAPVRDAGNVCQLKR